jgi:hypothetical protein
VLELNLPILNPLSACKNLLIAGIGGGFDIFCGLPIYFELRARGYNVHLANYSFSNIEGLKDGIRLTETLVGVNAARKGQFGYFPEYYLTRWFQEERGEEVTVWSFHKTGVRPLLENYRALIEHLGIDGILLIDGGIDSLLRGDEAEIGTLLEDAVSLIAVSELKEISVRLIACLGLGAEQEVTYAHVFENMAKLIELGGFWGTCSLVKEMANYQAYEEAVLYVFQQPNQDTSVINSSVISAVRGHYGNHHLTEKTRNSQLWISPFMTIYWFFELSIVARRNLLFSEMRWTDTITEAYRGLLKARRNIAKRKKAVIPLP